MSVEEAIEILRRVAAEPGNMSPAERRRIAEQLQAISGTLLANGEHTAQDATRNVKNASTCGDKEFTTFVPDSSINVGSSSSSGDPPPSASNDLKLELTTWKVADLKAALDECSIPRANLLEKRELVAALDAACQADPNKRLRVATFCEICCRTLPTDCFWPLTCKHMPCEDCLGRHLAVEAEKMQNNAKRHPPPCLFPDCKTPIAMATAGEFCKRVRKLWEDLGTREKLMKGAKYEIQECPRSGCVGIAYVEPGRSTAMCFICEHQWQVGNTSRDTSSQPKFSQNVRECPKCHIPIERSWGCNHMQCSKCGRKFDWDRATFANHELPHNSSASSGQGHFNEWPDAGEWMGTGFPQQQQFNIGFPQQQQQQFNAGFPQQQQFNRMAENMANGAANFATNFGFAQQFHTNNTPHHPQECTIA